MAVGGDVGTWVLHFCRIKHQMVSGVYLQSGGCGAGLMTCQVLRSVYGFRSLVPGYGHVRPRPRTAQGQDMVRRVVQVKHRSLCRQGGRTTTQTEIQYLPEELFMYLTVSLLLQTVMTESEQKEFINNNINHFLTNQWQQVSRQFAGLWA